MVLRQLVRCFCRDSSAWDLDKSTKTLNVQGFVFDPIFEVVPTEDKFAPKPIDQVFADTFLLSSRNELFPLESLLEIGYTITAGYSTHAPHNFSSAFAAFRLHLIKEAYDQGRRLSVDLSPEGNAEPRATAAPGHLDGIYWCATRFCTGGRFLPPRADSLAEGLVYFRQVICDVSSLALLCHDIYGVWNFIPRLWVRHIFMVL